MKNLKGNRQMQYAKQQIFLLQIQHLNIFARVNKKNGPYYQHYANFKKKLTKVHKHSTNSITLADCIQKL